MKRTFKNQPDWLSDQKAQELKDLTTLAIERTREVNLGVLQLIDSSYLRASLLAAVCLDLLRAAGACYENGTDEDEKYAMLVVLTSLVAQLDIDPDQLAIMVKKYQRGEKLR